MDRISQLSDDLLIKILSLLETSDSVATSILSKRWSSLWKLGPRLIFEDYSDEDDDDEETKESHWRNLSHFIYGTLLYHKAPVVETFHLDLASHRLGLEIDLWVRIAVDRFVRDLKISFHYDHGLIRLPSSLFRCETLETLELHRVIVSELPSRFTFQSLKELRLLSVKYPNEDCFHRFISSSPVLENLIVESCPNDNVTTFTINVPTLQSLTVRCTLEESENSEPSFVIHSHSLKLLNLLSVFGEVNIIGNMPKLVQANLQIWSHHEHLLKSLTSVKRLSLCLNEEAQYPVGSVFFQLVRLELCICVENWSKRFVSVLQHSPKLQILKLAIAMDHWMHVDRKICWIEPSSVPDCLVFHLKSFEWSYYDGFVDEKEVGIYILKNARQLVTATIDIDADKLMRKHEIFEEVEIATRSSRSCELTML